MTIEFKAEAPSQKPVLICHGAEGPINRHTLGITPAQDSPWTNQGVSLNPVDGKPLPFHTVPPIGEYQLLVGSVGAKWELHCPANGVDSDFDGWFHSEFTAAPSKIPMKLGHYRREILRTQPPFRALVVGDQVSAEITVGSFYTKTLLEGITVTWKLDGKEFIEPTSSTGVSRLSETVKNLGAQTITAEFHSPYEDKRVEASFDIVVYENSPWEQAKLFINGEQVERNEAFALLRGQENTVTVEVPSDVADEVSLELAENGGLNIAASPAFGCWVDRKDNKFTWFLTPDIGKSGRIKLIFLSHKVEQPWEHRCWVLAADLDEEVDKILVDNVPYPSSGITLFREDAPKIITLEFKPDSPLPESPSEWPLDLIATPITGLQPGDVIVKQVGDFTWEVSASQRSGTFLSEVKGAPFLTGIALPVSKVLSKDVVDEAEAWIEQKNITKGGNIFVVGQTHALWARPIADSPLGEHPIALQCDPQYMYCDPKSGEFFPAPKSWWFRAEPGKRGKFSFGIAGQDMNQMVIPDNYIVDADLNNDLKIEVNGVPMPATGMEFNAGQEYKIAAIFNDPDMAGLNLKLDVVDLSGVEKTDFTSEPPLGRPSSLANWAFKGTALKRGVFKLRLSTDNDESFLKTPENRLVNETLRFRTLYFTDLPLPPEIHNFPFNVIFYSAVRFLRGGLPVVGASVTLNVPEFGVRTLETDEKGVATLLEPIIYKTSGIRTFRAEVTYSGGSSTVEAIVNFLDASALETITIGS